MAKQRYYLDTRVLTAFFFAAMPFVAFGSFVVVNRRGPSCASRSGASLEQRAVQTKLALEQYLAEQVVHLRLAGARSRGAEGPRRARRAPSPTADGRAAGAGLGGRQGRRSSSPRSSSTPLAARLRAARARSARRSGSSRSSTPRAASVAASARGGRLFHGESAWFKDLAAQEGEPEVHVGEL